MSRQERSLIPISIPSSSHHHRHHNESHRSDSNSYSHTHSRHSKIHQDTVSTRQYYLEKIIIQKNEPPTSKLSAKINLQQKISGILNIFKISAGINEVTACIMKEVEKYCDYRNVNNFTQIQPSTNKTTVTTNASPRLKSNQLSARIKPQPNPLPLAKPSAKVLNVTPKTNKVVTPKKIIDRVVKNAKHQGKSPAKIPRELLHLINSDGFVEKPPSENKRTPKAVLRYDDTEFEQQSTRPTRKRRRSSSFHQTHSIFRRKTIEKNMVRPNFNQIPSQTSVTKVKRTVEHTVTTTSALTITPQGCIAQAATAPQAGNFLHKSIRITHYPMIEIKIEPNQ